MTPSTPSTLSTPATPVGSGLTPRDHFLFGGDYNPEQWDAATRAEDVELMLRAGVDTATVGVFAWSWLEPAEGHYEFGWLDEVFERLHAAGIGVVLATPTASPPPWFTLAHPDALPVQPDGSRHTHGSRDTYAISAPAYRDACRRIARALAERYGTHPALRGWHIHNEYGSLDHSDHAAAAFRRWLKRRYGTLEELNRCWGTAFWSQRYGDWAEILPPRQTQYMHNPTHALDFRRCTADEFRDAYAEQVAEIRAAGSTAAATTNFMLPSWNHLDHWSWRPHLDAVSIDHYLDTTGPSGETHVAYAGDLARSWAGGHPWLLMEQGTTQIALGDRHAHKAPDRVLRNTLSYLARGSQGALFFQWRASAAGSETWHGGMVPHTGPDTARFESVVELGATLRRLAEAAEPPTEGPVVDADVAILWEADGWWALENDGLPSDRLGFPEAVRRTHAALWRSGIPADFVPADADLSGYRVLLVPSMMPVSAELAERWQQFTAAGGTVVIGYFTGMTDERLHVVRGGYPGALRDLLGIRTTELHPLATGEHVRLSDGTPTTHWSEHIELRGAEAELSYADGPLDGLPAVTRHPVGAGHAWYVSTHLPDDTLRRFLDDICSRSGVTPTVAGLPDGVEAVRRRGRDHTYLFVLNHGTSALHLTGGERELTRDTDLTAEPVRVPPRGVAVVRENTKPVRVETAY
ncbi:MULTISPECIES: beta-galactosidase [unclassified Streptomyces]|uniref:beta-galactosidase n=1 Tax=unclassified Streptomyces TaxID=2593676 RepID=UPI00278BB7EB|nr:MULTISPECIES: beta-galactosidase [unclassified Streptomyces]